MYCRRGVSGGGGGGVTCQTLRASTLATGYESETAHPERWRNREKEVRSENAITL